MTKQHDPNFKNGFIGCDATAQRLWRGHNTRWCTTAHPPISLLYRFVCWPDPGAAAGAHAGGYGPGRGHVSRQDLHLSAAPIQQWQHQEAPPCICVWGIGARRRLKKNLCAVRVPAGWGGEENSRKNADEPDPTTYTSTSRSPIHDPPQPEAATLAATLSSSPAGTVDEAILLDDTRQQINNTRWRSSNTPACRRILLLLAYSSSYFQTPAIYFTLSSRISHENPTSYFIMFLQSDAILLRLRGHIVHRRSYNTDASNASTRWRSIGIPRYRQMLVYLSSDFKHYLVTLSCLFGIFMEALRVMTSRTPETDNAAGNWPPPQSIRYWIYEETW